MLKFQIYTRYKDSRTQRDTLRYKTKWKEALNKLRYDTIEVESLDDFILKLKEDFGSNSAESKDYLDCLESLIKIDERNSARFGYYPYRYYLRKTKGHDLNEILLSYKDYPERIEEMKAKIKKIQEKEETVKIE